MKGVFEDTSRVFSKHSGTVHLKISQAQNSLCNLLHFTVAVLAGGRLNCHSLPCHPIYQSSTFLISHLLVLIFIWRPPRLVGQESRLYNQSELSLNLGFATYQRGDLRKGFRSFWTSVFPSDNWRYKYLLCKTLKRITNNGGKVMNESE